MLTLDSRIEEISKIGAANARRLKRLDLNTVQDLLFYFPFRYDNFSKVSNLKNIRQGEKINIIGTVEFIQAKKTPRKRMHITEAIISDDTWQIKAVWFNQPYIAKSLKEGDTISLSGKVETDYGGWLLKSPTYEKVFANELASAKARGLEQSIIPTYHLTQNLTQKQISFLIKQVIPLADKLFDWLPVNILTNQKLLTLPEAIKKIHFPESLEEAEKARQRLAFNELFLLQIQSLLVKAELKNRKANKIVFQEQKTKEFVDSLPFKLTDAQKKAAWSILLDMDKEQPMSRLLQGDVGSGKTVVAVMALLNCALNKKQAVLMVPTEILAQQHFKSIIRLLSYSEIRIGLLTRSEKKINFEFDTVGPESNEEVKSEREKLEIGNWEIGLSSNEGELEKVDSGKIKVKRKKENKINAQAIVDSAEILIGTHALIQEKICFSNLELVVIDEQHRFGVEQRKTLLSKSQPSTKSSSKKIQTPVQETSPHLLSMTATPIPRSLALALYGDLDISRIDEMPTGRKPITTRLIKEEGRAKAYAFIRQQIQEGRQVFVICPLIDISDKLGVKSVKEEYRKLNELVFPEFAIGLLHGQLKAAEKDEVMQKFITNEVKLLVSTSVVEVGVDIPNATIMMIEGADRFGLSQLHQFRGRVGRSDHQSYCFLFTDSNSAQTAERLNALATHHNGLELAKIDLKFRGPGEIFGTSQKGFPELKMASLFDYDLTARARKEADDFLKDNSDLSRYPALKMRLNRVVREAHQE